MNLILVLFSLIHRVRYGLLPMVLSPKLTKVDKGKVCLSLLDGRRAASADSVQMRILYSPRKGVQSCLHNNIITMYFCQFSELDDTYVGHRRLLCRGGCWSTWSCLIFPPFRPSPMGGGHYQFWVSKFHLLSFTGTGTV